MCADCIGSYTVRLWRHCDGTNAGFVEFQLVFELFKLKFKFKLFKFKLEQFKLEQFRKSNILLLGCGCRCSAVCFEELLALPWWSPNRR